MGKFTVVSPQGDEYTVNGPDGSTQQQAIKYVQHELSKGTIKPTKTAEESAAYSSLLGGGAFSGGAGAMSPPAQEKTKELFAKDPSKAGRVGVGEYIKNALTGAAIGGVVGGVAGLATGPGAVGTALIGAGEGAVSGLAESYAKDKGYGAGTQLLAGMASPYAASKGLSKVASTSPARKLGSALVEDVEKYGSKIPILGRFIGNKKVQTSALEKATGIKAASEIQPGSVENVTKARSDIAQKYGLQPNQVDNAESHVYEMAKQAYDGTLRTGKDFTSSPEFKGLIAQYPKTSQKYMAQTYGQIFKQGKSLKPGDTVINDLKNLQLTPAQDKEIKTTFNDFLERETGQRWEQEARSSAEKVFVAKAKDELPSLLINSGTESAASADARRTLKGQIENFSKTPETRKVFWQETTHALNNMSVKDAKSLWTSIGPEVRRTMIKDPQQYDKITAIMSGAREKKDVSRAVKLMVTMRGATAGALSATEGNNQ